MKFQFGVSKYCKKPVKQDSLYDKDGCKAQDLGRYIQKKDLNLHCPYRFKSLTECEFHLAVLSFVCIHNFDKTISIIIIRQSRRNRTWRSFWQYFQKWILLPLFDFLLLARVIVQVISILVNLSLLSPSMYYGFFGYCFQETEVR